MVLCPSSPSCGFLSCGYKGTIFHGTLSIYYIRIGEKTYNSWIYTMFDDRKVHAAGAAHNSNLNKQTSRVPWWWISYLIDITIHRYIYQTNRPYHHTHILLSQIKINHDERIRWLPTHLTPLESIVINISPTRSTLCIGIEL